MQQGVEKDENTWSIIQFKLNKSKDKVQHLFQNALDPLKHHTIAMQEPWKYPRGNTTVKHPAYYLAFPNYKNTCIYISKAKAIEKWKMEQTPDEAKGDSNSISLKTNKGRI